MSKVNRYLVFHGEYVYNNRWASGKQPYMQLFLDLNLRLHNWYQINTPPTKKLNNIEHYQITTNELLSANDRAAIPPPITIGFYDLEVFRGENDTNPKTVPKPEGLSNYITHASIVIIRDNKIITNIVIANTPEFCVKDVIFVKDEYELLLTFFRELRNHSLAILIGFMNYRFDNQWIFTRATMHDLDSSLYFMFVPILENLTKHTHQSSLSIDDWIQSSTAIREATEKEQVLVGQIPCITELDMNLLLNRHFPRQHDQGNSLNSWLTSFDLETKFPMSFAAYQLLIHHHCGTKPRIRENILGIESFPISTNTFMQLINVKYAKLKLEIKESHLDQLYEDIITYNRYDSMALLTIARHTNILPLSLANINVVPITVFNAAHGGISNVVAPAIISHLKTESIVVGVIDLNEASPQTVKGGLVVPVCYPADGIVNTPTMIVDFRSLYPNLVITYDISPERLLSPFDKIPGDCVEICINQKIIRNHRKNNPPAILPSIIAKTLKARALNRKKMANASSDAEYQFYDSLQLGCKSISNSVIGFFASGFQVRHTFVTPQIAQQVTHLGGYETIIMCLTAMTFCRFFIIGGDTDSVFLTPPMEFFTHHLGESLSIKDFRIRMLQLIDQLKEELDIIFDWVISKLNGFNTLQFEHEATFLPFILCAPKHYAGAYHNNPSQYELWNPNIPLTKQAKCKGMTMIKRGAAAITKIYEPLVLSRGLNLNNTQSLGDIAVTAASELINTLSTQANLGKTIHLSLARPHERGMTWHWVYATAVNVLLSGAFIIPSTDERIEFIVTKQPKLRDFHGKSQPDMLSSRQIPTALLEVTKAQVDILYYAQAIPLSQFLVYQQVPPGNKKDASKEASAIISEIVQKHIDVQEGPRRLIAINQQYVKQAATMLEELWISHDPNKLCVQSLISNSDQNFRIHFGATYKQMIRLWLFTLLNSLLRERPEYDQVNNLMTIPGLYEWSFIMSCLCCFFIHWISRIWQEGEDAVRNIPPLICTKCCQSTSHTS